VAASVGDLLSSAAASLRPEMPTLCSTLVGLIVRELPELAADTSLSDLLDASVAANVSTALGVFEQVIDEAEMEAPAAAVEYARRLAQRGIPISALLRSYRLGQAGFQQRMIAQIATQAAEIATIVEASIRLSDVTFGYIDTISEKVVAAHQAERERWLRNRGAVRSARVMSILADGTADIDEAEKVLGYPLRQFHRAAVVWNDDHTGQQDQLSRLERVVTKLAEHYGSERAPLIIAPDESTIWAWLPMTEAASIRRDIAKLAPSERVWIALGDPAPGVDGFRLSHRQARQAQIVAMSAGAAHRGAITESRTAGPVALMCTDLEAVRAWVATVLGPLAVDDEANERLRETVWSFLSSNGSYTAAAQELMLHKNTVQYRIRKAEQARGRPLSDGRLDVEVALLAATLLGAAVLQPAR
jgi:sugar diacid utilization regulator